jgi:hypothetical protein
MSDGVEEHISFILDNPLMASRTRFVEMAVVSLVQ